MDGGKPGTDLQDSTWYLYRVVSINEIGVEGRPSPPVKVKTLPPPAPIKNFRARDNEVRSVPLAWDAPCESDVIGYEVERRESPNSEFKPLVKLTDAWTLSYLDGKRDPGTLKDAQRYEYRIRVYNRVGSYGPWSDPLAATTRPPPPAPESLAALSGRPRFVELYWAVSPDDKVVAYEVERAAADAELFVPAGRVDKRQDSFFTDRAEGRASDPAGRLKDETTYRYRVRAINTAGAASDWSEEATATTKPAPAAPTGLQATTDRPKAVHLVWKANPEPDIVSYVIESRVPDSSRWAGIGRSSEPVFEHERLSDGETRMYRVKAVDKDTLESAWSEEVRGSSRPLPEPPQNISLSWKESGAHLQWAFSEQTISEYRIYRKGLFSREQVATSHENEADLGWDVIQKGITVFVTAVDAEDLASMPSLPVSVKPETGQK